MTKKPSYRLFHRLFLALSGLGIAIKRERHMKVHLGIAIVLTTPLFVLDIPANQAILLIILLGLLLTVELINTAIEITIDLITRKYSYRAKLAKDMASGAVLIVGILTVGLAIFIYGPYMYTLVKEI